MALTKQDISLIKEALKPEFDGVEKRIKDSLQPEFVKLEKKLTAKINALRRENRRDHNTIINTFDKRDIELKKRVSKIEDRLGFPTYHSALI